MTAATILQTTRIIYYVLLAGQCLYGLVTLYLFYVQPDGFQTGELPYRIAFYVPALLILAMYFGARFISKSRLAAANRIRGGLAAKLGHYRITTIIRSAVAEAGNLFVLTFALMTFDGQLLLYFAAGLAMFLVFRPRITEFEAAYPLSGGEQSELDRLKNPR
ncbi:MAG: hypothetical protein WBA17_14985 [Saprospiraceae bacterium]